MRGRVVEWTAALATMAAVVSLAWLGFVVMRDRDAMQQELDARATAAAVPAPTVAPVARTTPNALPTVRGRDAAATFNFTPAPLPVAATITVAAGGAGATAAAPPTRQAPGPAAAAPSPLATAAGRTVPAVHPTTAPGAACAECHRDLRGGSR